MDEPRGIKVLCPSYLTGTGVPQTAFELASSMNEAAPPVTLYVSAGRRSLRPPFVRATVPLALQGPAYRLLGPARLKQWTERRFVRSLRPGEVAHVFPGVSRETNAEARGRGAVVAVECTNCHQAVAKRILDEAYDRLGWPARHGITDRSAAAQRERLAWADYVFSPSPWVASSLRESGVPEHKILHTSYGWSPQRLGLNGKAGNGANGHDRPPRNDAGLTVLFVGLLCVRKGVPLLLQAWARAGIKGRLLLAGRVDADVGERCAALLNRSDVEVLGFRPDVGQMYREADVFAFPTLEEGGPLVTYEAMACGLPVVASPMGGGVVVRDGVDGLVVDPYDEEAWIAALRRMANDVEARRAMGRSAAERAGDFTWAKVGRQRTAMIAQRLAARERRSAGPGMSTPAGPAASAAPAEERQQG